MTTIKNKRIIRNPSKYLSQDLIKECFDFETINVIDKEICGNGMSTGFLSLQKEFRQTDILVAPNKSVVIDKRADYENGQFPNKKIGFIYEGCSIDWNIKYDVIVCVVDSFNHNSKDLNRTYNIRYILVDEQHTVEQGANFRKKAMFDLKHSLSIFKFSAIATVTATPNLFANFNISIDNELKKPTKLFISKNIVNTIDRLLDKVKRGENVLIFTQNASLVKSILTQANRTDFNYKGGEQMKASLCNKGKYTFSDKSNITVCTSASYEGWSDYSKNGNAFMFSSYDNNHNAMLGSNVYQAIGRLREGSIHSELCIFDSTKNTKYIPNLLEVLEHLKSIKSKVTKKQGKRYEFKFKGVRYTKHDIKDFILFRENERGALTIEILRDAVNVHLEQFRASKGFKGTYEDFFNRRKVSLIDIDDDVVPKIKGSITPELEKINNLLFTLPNNLEVVDLALYPFLDGVSLSKLKSTLRVNIAVRKGLNYCSNSEQKAYNFIESKDFERTILDLCIKSGLESGKHSEEKTIEWFETSNILETTYSLIYQILSGSHNYHKVGFREYSLFTSVPNSLLKLIADKLEISFTELDIKTAYPKFLFASFGLDVPTDFYDTKDRVNSKIKVNTILNSLSSKTDSLIRKERRLKGQNTTKTYLQNRAYKKTKTDRIELLKYFPLDITTYLIDTFGKSNYDSSLFFEVMTRHEKTLISKCRKMIKDANNDNESFSLVRKHDAILIFHKDNLSLNNAMQTSYLGFNNWFAKTEYSSHILNTESLLLAS